MNGVNKGKGGGGLACVCVFVCEGSSENVCRIIKELDGEGSVDNRPSNDKLHHFVKKKPITC